MYVSFSRRFEMSLVVFNPCDHIDIVLISSLIHFRKLRFSEEFINVNKAYDLLINTSVIHE